MTRFPRSRPHLRPAAGHIVLAVALLSLLLALLPERPLGAQPSPPLLGFHLNKGDALHMAAARAAGGRFAVLLFKWADIEPAPGYLYWEEPDAALRAAQYHGIELVVRLDHPPAWATGDNADLPWNPHAYTAFVARVVERYGARLAGVIIGNEPNLAAEWQDRRPDPAAYVRVLRTVYPAVKQVDPDMPVLLAGLAFHRGDGDNWNDLDYLKEVYAAGGGDFFDVAAAHPYGFGRPPREAPSADRLNFRRLELQRRIMVANGDGHKPVWITEMGWRLRAPDPADAWQVVSPAVQTDYLLQALEYAAARSWLERIALWRLDGDGDEYGYDLWQGPGAQSPAYRRLVSLCRARDPACGTSPPGLRPDAARSLPIPILAGDVTIRLGDRDTLHPHWVHLHAGGEDAHLIWEGEFYLTRDQAERPLDLLLETMQIDQPTARLFLNGVEMAHLRPRPRPDPTSTWSTQRHALPAGLLRPGVNALRISVGLRNPAWQVDFWRWENMQFRNVRLVAAETRPPSLVDGWTSLARPGGWSDAIRLRRGADDAVWLTGNRPGELWRSQDGGTSLAPQAGNRPDLLFVDVLPTEEGALVASGRGLFWRPRGEATWRPVAGAPRGYAYVVIAAGQEYVAGFEGAGVWRAPHPWGPWTADGLDGRTVLDLVHAAPSDRLYAATDRGVWVRSGRGWQPLLPTAPDESADPAFVTRLFLEGEGLLIARSGDGLWRRDSPGRGWRGFGPGEGGDLFATLGCCGAGTLVAGANGLWQMDDGGDWRRLDRDGTFSALHGEIHTLLDLDGRLYMAGTGGLFYSDDGGAVWRQVAGLPAIVSDLHIDVAAPNHWLAATATGVQRSDDAGATWRPLGPPWGVRAMATGLDGRLYLARTHGIAWTEQWQADPVVWRESEGSNRVYFFSVAPSPTDPTVLWTGSWGNDIRVSDDGGETLQPLGNGLETLSVLDILWHATPGQLTIATIEGLYRSDNGGASWFKLPGPLGQQTVYALFQTEDGQLWAAAGDGLWRSTDHGASWSRAAGVPPTTAVEVGRVDGSAWLWVGTEGDGLWLSPDGGRRWGYAGLSGLAVYALLRDPHDPERLLAATNRGIFEAPMPRPQREAPPKSPNASEEG